MESQITLVTKMKITIQILEYLDWILLWLLNAQDIVLLEERLNIIKLAKTTELMLRNVKNL